MNHLKTKCEGCGAKVQTTDPGKKGYIKSEVYIKNTDHFLCERCYNLQHYNKVADIAISEKEFFDNAKKIAASDALVVNIVDVFDLEGTLIPNINELFPNHKIMIVANKFDLFLSSTKPNKVLNYLRNYVKQQGINAIDVSLISAKSSPDVTRLINKLYKYKESEDIYFFGVTNVGKSTIINHIIQLVENKVTPVTVSNLPGTTLGLIKLSLPQKTYLIDTPGIIHQFQFTKYLDKATLNLVLPQKFVKPKVYQLNPEQSVFVGVDPYYLTYKAQALGYQPEVILSGRKINDGMGKWIAEKTIKKMIANDIKIKQARVLIMGLTFKENCGDLRNSKVVDIINELRTYGIEPFVTDPLADKQEAKTYYNVTLVSKSEIKDMDAVILAVAHDSYKELPLTSIKNYYRKSLKKGVLIDIKSIVKKDNPFFDLWRL